MNPFERIKEYRTALLLQTNNTKMRLTDTLTYREHYKVLLNLLDMLEADLQNAEYNYVIEKVDKNNSDLAYTSSGDVTLQAFHLSPDLLVFQPLFKEDDQLDAADIDSLAAVLQELKNHNRIKEDILIVPPNINILKAKLSESNNNPAPNDSYAEDSVIPEDALYNETFRYDEEGTEFDKKMEEKMAKEKAEREEYWKTHRHPCWDASQQWK